MYKYTISPSLLKNIKKIALMISDLEHKKYPKPVLAKYELSANTLSSFSSTNIEGNPLPLTEVKKILKSRPSKLRDSEREVLNYNDCLVWLNQKLSEKKVSFNLDLILQIHKKVTQGLLPKYQTGTLRNEPVFVNNPKLRKTVYWPPDHDDVGKLLSELIKFVNENQEKLDPIIVAGIFHKQFVVIHPFVDGNGRTVRLATKILLAKMGFNTFHLFSFENFYNQNVTKYFEKVGVLGNYYDIYKKIDHTEWLEYFTDGIIDELLRVVKDLDAETISPDILLNKDQLKILEFLAEHGVIRDREYSKFTERAKATRTNDFNKLIALDKIEKFGQGPSVYYKLKTP